MVEAGLRYKTDRAARPLIFPCHTDTAHGEWSLSDDVEETYRWNTQCADARENKSVNLLISIYLSARIRSSARVGQHSSGGSQRVPPDEMREMKGAEVDDRCQTIVVVV